MEMVRMQKSELGRIAAMVISGKLLVSFDVYIHYRKVCSVLLFWSSCIPNSLGNGMSQYWDGWFALLYILF
ncbi:hypothetical protein CDL12_30192 [Handroanthus impetiginosus]|uniref:Uncharacterized protein n=1 Tax=Handroanthus impetiginosus TaxID=429701 RepID=A0A2G9FWA2_9LAMI|nr:hypothetical protein CDL12_30439 [Handroanthus impetiginosus]PIM97338.1 hypothetical protein CDL12_30192 [Handroanthus impetiginosus]